MKPTCIYIYIYCASLVPRVLNIIQYPSPPRQPTIPTTRARRQLCSYKLSHFCCRRFFFYFSVSWSRGCGVFFHFLVPDFLFGLFPVSWSHGWFYIRQMGFLDGLKSMNRLLWLIFFLRFYFSLLVFRMGSKKFYLNVYY